MKSLIQGVFSDYLIESGTIYCLLLGFFPTKLVDAAEGIALLSARLHSATVAE